MKIECILKRQGGSFVELGDQTYHFKPQADGAHVADVSDEEHADKLLSITEAYREYEGQAQAEAGEEVATPAATRSRKKATAAAVEEHPVSNELGG